MVDVALDLDLLLSPEQPAEQMLRLLVKEVSDPNVETLNIIVTPAVDHQFGAS